jgi:hypothetical protein
MLERSQDRMKEEEIGRLRRLNRPNWISRLAGRAKPDSVPDASQHFLEAYRVSVDRCVISSNFSEELPLYFLDAGGEILVLFGQWMYDPHISKVPKQIFESWDCDKTFFANFGIKYHPRSGVVFEFKVEKSSFVTAERDSHRMTFKRLNECQLIRGRADTLIHDLQGAGLIEV